MDILNKINQRLYTHEEYRDMEIVLEISMILDDSANMNEAFDLNTLKKGAGALLKSIGGGAHKSGDGLIQVALKSGKLMAEFIWHTLRAAAGNEDSKVRMKELANTQITKEQVLDFLLKLDMATLHLVSGPLHLIDAVTGWHIWAHIKTKSEDMLTKAKNAITNLTDAAKEAGDEVKNKLKQLMHGIARLFGLDDLQSVIKSI